MRGPLLLLAALGLFALLDANSKLLSGTYPASQVVALRLAVLLALLGLARWWRPGAGGALTTRRPGAQLLRAGCVAGSAFGYFLAFRGLPIAQGYVIAFVGPFIMLGLSHALLRERVPPAAWGWCALGFAGVLVALWPALADSLHAASGPPPLAGPPSGPVAGAASRPATGGGGLAPVLWGLLGAACHAGVMTANRALRHEPGTARLILWSSLPGLLAAAPFALWHWVAPGAADAAALLVNGALAGAATLLLAEAFRHAPPARLAPLEFSVLAWGLALDLLIWQVRPEPRMLAGAAIVVLAGVMSGRVRRVG